MTRLILVPQILSLNPNHPICFGTTIKGALCIPPQAKLARILIGLSRSKLKFKLLQGVQNPVGLMSKLIIYFNKTCDPINECSTSTINVTKNIFTKGIMVLSNKQQETCMYGLVMPAITVQSRPTVELMVK